MKVTIYQRTNQLPELSTGNFFHSRELMALCERTPRMKPYMAVVTDEDGVVQATVGQTDLIGQEDDVLQHLGQALLTGEAIDSTSTLLGTQQAANEFQQSGLPHSILAEESINVPLRER